VSSRSSHATLGARRYRLGTLLFDAERLALFANDAVVPLAPKALATLALLVERAGTPIAKDEFLDALWPDADVGEAALAQSVYLVRRTLRAHGLDGAIRTLPRRGYVFTAVVRADGDAPRDALHAPTARRTRGALRRAVAAAAALALVLIGVTIPPAPRPAAALAPETDRLYRLGRYYWQLRTMGGMARSVAYFNAVVSQAPRSPLGYAGLADAYAELAEYRCDDGVPCAGDAARAQRFAGEALAHAPASAAALTSQARVVWLFGLDFARSDALFRRALAAEPDYAIAHEWRGLELLDHGHLVEAHAELARAAVLEPVATVIYAGLARVAYYQRDYAAAIAYAREAISLNPRRVESLTLIGLALEQLGRRREARDAFRALIAADADRPDERVLEAELLAHAGARTAAGARIDSVIRSHPRDGYALLDAALGYVTAGRATTALRLLPRIPFGGGLSRTWTALDPRLDPVRNDPRFARWTTVTG
jgi:DNA-binding winged helix-turn-helix (wHTH) protein/Flp pilus assembly protein TadD